MECLIPAQKYQHKLRPDLEKWVNYVEKPAIYDKRIKITKKINKLIRSLEYQNPSIFFFFDN